MSCRGKVCARVGWLLAAVIRILTGNDSAGAAVTRAESPQPAAGLASSAVAAAPIAWPSGVTAAACLTFDMDAEAPVLTADISSIGRMTPMSHHSYGPLVGVARILALLKRHDVTATFFIAGYSAPAMAGEDTR
jgi:hypothetical protein